MSQVIDPTPHEQVGRDSELRKLTVGQYRVGITFNPGGHPTVNTIKEKAAELIDLLETYRVDPVNGVVSHPEVQRLLALAQTHIEDAAMWGVKAVTKPPR